MKCEDLKTKLTSYLLGDLDQETKVLVEKHLKECEDCQAELDGIEPTLDILRAALAEPSISHEKLSDARKAVVIEESSQKKPLKVDWWLTKNHPRLAMAASFAIIVGFLWAVAAPLFTPMGAKEMSDDAFKTRRKSGERLKSREGSLELYFNGSPDANPVSQLSISEPQVMFGAGYASGVETINGFPEGVEDEPASEPVSWGYADKQAPVPASKPVSGPDELGYKVKRRVSKKVPLKTELPSPLFQGTPKNIKSDNLEEPGDLYSRPTTVHESNGVAKHREDGKDENGYDGYSVRLKRKPFGGFDDNKLPLPPAPPRIVSAPEPAPDTTLPLPNPAPPADFSPTPARFDAVAIVKSPIIMDDIYGSRTPAGRKAAIAQHGGGGGGTFTLSSSEVESTVSIPETPSAKNEPAVIDDYGVGKGTVPVGLDSDRDGFVNFGEYVVKSSTEAGWGAENSLVAPENDPSDGNFSNNGNISGTEKLGKSYEKDADYKGKEWKSTPDDVNGLLKDSAKSLGDEVAGSDDPLSADTDDDGLPDANEFKWQSGASKGGQVMVPGTPVVSKGKKGDVYSFGVEGRKSGGGEPDHKEGYGLSNVGRQGMLTGETAGSGTTGDSRDILSRRAYSSTQLQHGENSSESMVSPKPKKIYRGKGGAVFSYAKDSGTIPGVIRMVDGTELARQEENGRSNIGRQGMSTGETAAGSGAVREGGVNREERRTQDPTQSGQLADSTGYRDSSRTREIYRGKGGSSNEGGRSNREGQGMPVGETAAVFSRINAANGIVEDVFKVFEEVKQKRSSEDMDTEAFDQEDMPDAGLSMGALTPEAAELIGDLMDDDDGSINTSAPGGGKLATGKSDGEGFFDGVKRMDSEGKSGLVAGDRYLESKRLKETDGDGLANELESMGLKVAQSEIDVLSGFWNINPEKTERANGKRLQEEERLGLENRDKALAEAKAKEVEEEKKKEEPPKRGLNKNLEREEMTGPVFKAWGVNNFVATANNPLSTFAIDVDTAAYTVMRNYASRGLLPPAEAVRTEEFVNFFDYAYDQPRSSTFEIHADVAPSKFGRGKHMLKLGIKGRKLGREEQRRAVVTLLIDTSGSMDQPDRMDLVKKSLKMLLNRLDPKDQVAIVQYSSEARLVMEHTSAKHKDQILKKIDALICGGSTNLEKGMGLAYSVASSGFVGGGENRVIILSDGAANLGSTEADGILKKVEKSRKQGVYCSVLGFGMGTYNDTMLESLANKGDGTYSFIDSEDEARRVLVQEFSATLNTIARDVKIQVEFNKKRVSKYRQVGYENRQLKAKDFRNDAIDAGEVGSGQSVTALYELELDGKLSEHIGVIRVRYRRADTGKIEEVSRGIKVGDLIRSFDDTDARFKLATCVAEYAEILRGSPFAKGSEFEDVAKVLRPVALELTLDKRVQELLRIISAAHSYGR